MAKKVSAAAKQASAMPRTTFDHHYREIVGAEEKAKTASANKGTATKKAKDDGLNIWSWKRLIELKKMQPDDAMRAMKDLVLYAQYLSLEVGQQLSFFIQDNSKPRSAKEQAKKDEFDVREEGRKAARAGASRESNPHKAGTILAQGWDLGWLEIGPGNEEGTKVKPAPSPRKGRGVENEARTH